MAKWIVILSLLTVIFGCSRNNQLSVTSFNLGSQNAPDTLNNWDNRTHLIQSFLKNSYHDIIAFQSVTKDRDEFLKSILPDYNYFGNPRDTDEMTTECAPVYFKAKNFNVLAKSSFGLYETYNMPDSTNSSDVKAGIVSWGKLQNISSGHIFFIFNSQFISDNEETNMNAVRFLLRRVNEIAGNAPVIMTGSYSFNENNPAYQILTSNWDRFHSFENCMILSGSTTGNDRTTYNGFEKDTRSKIYDHIFVNSYIHVVKHSITVKRSGSVFISDHYPVSAKIRFPFERRIRGGVVVPDPWETQ